MPTSGKLKLIITPNNIVYTMLNPIAKHNLIVVSLKLILDNNKIISPGISKTTIADKIDWTIKTFASLAKKATILNNNIINSLFFTY